MRIFLVVALFFIWANSDNLKSCKACHPIIYSEFEQSMHKKSTPNGDKIHKAVWDRHPSKGKGDYKCAKCHSPQDKGAEFNQRQGVTCLSCHMIKDIEEHKKANKNIYETKDKLLYSAQKGMEDKKVIYKKETSWFGLSTQVTGSPYHDIDYTKDIFYNGKVCMGCHSHKQNSLGFTVCKTDIGDTEDNKQNCITCHMPKVKGSATNIRISKTHAYHGFAGAINRPDLLSKYIDMDYKISDNGFSIAIYNRAEHNLMLHPLRVLELHTKLKRGDKIVELKSYSFKRVIGDKGKPSMPWLATEVLEDTTIKGDENRTINFDIELKSGDEIESTLGYYIVNPNAVSKLGLDSEVDLKKFTTLKHIYFKVK